MQSLAVLIYQHSPAHQITLHQALNAQGVYDVRVAASLGEVYASLARRAVDLLVIDQALPPIAVRALLYHLAACGSTRAVLLVGEPHRADTGVQAEACRLGLWVLAQVGWPLSATALQAALRKLGRGRAFTSVPAGSRCFA